MDKGINGGRLGDSALGWAAGSLTFRRVEMSVIPQFVIAFTAVWITSHA